MSLVEVTLSAPGTAEKGQAFTVSGTVFEGPAPLRLGPIAGATVTIYQGGTSKGTATTSGSGLYSKSISINQTGTFPLLAKALGVYSNIDYITITAPPEPPYVNSVSISAPASKDENDSFTITGRVLDQFGVAMAGVTVSLQRNGTSIGSDATNSTGYYSKSSSISNAGVYTLRATADSKSASRTITINEPEPEGWLYIENYRGYPIYLWQTPDEYYGYWFASEGEQMGPYATLQECRTAIDGIIEPEPEPGWEYHSTYRGIDIQVWMPDGTPYTAYFDDEWHMAALLSTLQAAIDDFLEPAVGIPTTLTISAPDRTGVNENFNISGILNEMDTGIPIPNQPINHSYDGRSLGSSTTGVDGGYLKVVSVPEAGVWTLKSDFPGTEELQASRSLAGTVVSASPIATALLIAGPIVTGIALIALVSFKR